MPAQSFETSSLAEKATADWHGCDVVICVAGQVAAYAGALGGLTRALWRGLAEIHWGFAMLHMTGHHRGTPVDQGMGQGKLASRQNSSGLMPDQRIAFCNTCGEVLVSGQRVDALSKLHGS